MADREANGRFKPGHKILSDGRPKIPDELKAAIRGACPEAVETLIRIMRDPKEKTAYRLEAAKTLLDRGYGKPTQMQEIALDMAGGLDVTAQIRRVLLEGDNDGRGTEAAN